MSRFPCIQKYTTRAGQTPEGTTARTTHQGICAWDNHRQKGVPLEVRLELGRRGIVGDEKKSMELMVSSCGENADKSETTVKSSEVSRFGGTPSKDTRECKRAISCLAALSVRSSTGSLS